MALGSGLDALFEDNAIENKESQTLRMSEIEPNKSQPRKAFDEEEIRDWLNLSVNMVLFSLLLCALCQTVLLTR